MNVPERTNDTGAAALLEAMRIPHWIKNTFVAAPLLFSGRFVNLEDWWLCLAAVGAFCLLSSGIYLINDVCDRQNDRSHPIKSHRPVASNRLSVNVAMVSALVLLLGGFATTAAIVRLIPYSSNSSHGIGLAVWAIGYVVINLLYSLWLKSHAIVDVIIIALGFVLRAMAGAAAIAVPVSPWLVVCIFSLCLFIALTKRRSEIIELPEELAIGTRRSNRSYTRQNAEYMLTVSAALAILTYSLYCLAPRTVRHVGSAHMVWTIPLVVYGMFRYYCLTRQGGGVPVLVVLRDRVMWILLIVYSIVSGVILKYGSHPSVRDILDVDVFVK